MIRVVAAKAAPAAKPAPTRSFSATLQRKCACGSNSKTGGSCEECEEKRLQRKSSATSGPRGGFGDLPIGQPNDPYEQEADRIAEFVTRAPAAPHLGAIPKNAPLAIRRLSAGHGALSQVPSAVANVLASPGRQLDPDTRQLFENRFAHDFAGVRIHVDPAAAESIEAHAFTAGSHIVFGSGQYAPGTADGRKLLAHELTHVVQQGAAGSTSGPRAIQPATRRSSGLHIQRKPKPPYQGTILSLKEVNADPAHEKMRKLSGQTEARVCRSIGKAPDKENCPTLLGPKTKVMVTDEKAGGLWLQVDCKGIPNFGKLEQCHVLAAFVAAEEAPASASAAPKAAKTPSADAQQAAADDANKRSAMSHAAKEAAGIMTPQQYQQLICVINAGGSPSARDGGLPTEQNIEDYNTECSKQTGYAGKVTPSPDQWDELKPGTLDFVVPGRLAQVRSLLDEYAKLIRAGVLRDDEIATADAAIAAAEKKLGALQPPDKSEQPAGSTPWVIAGKQGPAGQPAMAMAGAAVMTMTPRAFSVIVRAYPPAFGAAVIVGGLVCIGYLINNYLVRKEGAGALEMLIGALLLLFRALNDAEIERRIKDKTKDKPKDKPEPGEDPKPKPGPTDPPPPRPRRPRCTFTPVGSGGNYVADLFCEKVVGASKGQDIMVTAPDGDKAWYDHIGANIAYECKCGYAGVAKAYADAARTGKRVARWAQQKMEDPVKGLDQQWARDMRVAPKCALTLRYLVSNKEFADFLNDRWGTGTVHWAPDDLCD